MRALGPAWSPDACQLPGAMSVAPEPWGFQSTCRCLLPHPSMKLPSGAGAPCPLLQACQGSGPCVPPPRSVGSDFHPCTALIFGWVRLRMKGAAARASHAPHPPGSRAPPRQRRPAPAPGRCEAPVPRDRLPACLTEPPPGAPWELLAGFSSCLCPIGAGGETGRSQGFCASECGLGGSCSALATVGPIGPGRPLWLEQGGRLCPCAFGLGDCVLWPKERSVLGAGDLGSKNGTRGGSCPVSGLSSLSCK